MPALKKDIYVEQGATFSLELVWRHAPADPDAEGVPVDLTGASARMQFRRAQQSEVIVEATSSNGMISLGDDSGTIEIELPGDTTSEFTVKKAKYDLEIEMPDGRIHRLLEGAVTISPNITQEDGEPVLS